MAYAHKLLRVLITEHVKKILREQEEELDLGGDSGADLGGDDLDLGGDELDDPTAEGGDDLGGDSELGEDGGELGGADGELGDDLEGGDDFGGDMDFGGGGGMGGFGGGGGGVGDLGGDDGGLGGDEESSDDSEPAPEEDAIPDEPNQGVVDDVKAALEQTQDVQTLLNVAKSSVQKYFDSFGEAGQVLELLKQEEDPILQDVAKRLQMFLTGF